ncbi:transcriptional regulator [Sphaerochaeta pleomorpha str. Grapes]|uniref:Transcriptional regulator n=1 Tax=Sphaerochaeta pleomorpha (strain ATCC BAA-1885 / DSM 22778 / Grapes) TaxID=158190 RepID=G8QT13_SPHPG|nr:TetR/AcrR family transcriptional regulator [Sphaerochaeta pleomorpha]AEV27918.1 transcriptional regulator [Sphaerochaeta pleomorpha str. Grapes]
MDTVTPKRERNKEQTQQRLINATIELLKTDGFASLGINAIAAQAKVNKALIYRYFDGLPGLMRAAANELDLTQTKLIDFSLPQTEGKIDLKEYLVEIFQSLHQNLQNDSLAQKLMIQELSEENEMTRTFAEAREQQGLEVTEQSKVLFSNLAGKEKMDAFDLQSALAITSAAIYYLTMRSTTVQMFNGVDIQSKEGWDRICSTLATFFEKALTSPV